MCLNIIKYTRQLYDNRLLRSIEETVRFEEALSKIHAQKNINYIPNLLIGLDDESSHEEVTFGVIHTLESFYSDDNERQFNQILLLSIEKDIMLPHAKNWLEIIIMRTLNDDQATETFKKALIDSGTHSKEVVKSMITNILTEDANQFGVNGSSILKAIG